MTTIAIVQCGAKKRSKPSRASELYIGSLFIACKRAALAIADRWYIVSAKHGLIRPSAILVPYEQTLPTKGDPVWGKKVVEKLKEFEPDGWDRLVVLASSKYLVGWAEELKAETPLKGLSLGYAIQKAVQLRKEVS